MLARLCWSFLCYLALVGNCSATETPDPIYQSNDKSVHHAKHSPNMTHHSHNKSNHHTKQSLDVTHNSNNKSSAEEIFKPVKRFQGNFIAKKDQKLTLLISITSGPDNILRDAARYQLWHDVLITTSLSEVH